MVSSSVSPTHQSRSQSLQFSLSDEEQSVESQPSVQPALETSFSNLAAENRARITAADYVAAIETAPAPGPLLPRPHQDMLMPVGALHNLHNEQQIYRLSPTAIDMVFQRYGALTNDNHNIDAQNPALPGLTAPLQPFPAANSPWHRLGGHQLFEPIIAMLQNMDDEAPYSSRRLQPGVLAKSAVTVQFTAAEANPHWTAFSNKYQSFVQHTGSNLKMIERLEAVIVQAQDKPSLKSQLFRIAEDANADCHDAALASLIEMEKVCLKSTLCENFNNSLDSDALLSQVLQLAHGLYSLEVLESLAQTIGKLEESEVFLYLLQDHGELINSPIAAADFCHGQYVEELSFEADGKMVNFADEKSYIYLHNKIINATHNELEFAKSLAQFEPYGEYLIRFPLDDSDQASASKPSLNFKIEQIQEQAQQLCLELSEAVLEQHILNTLHAIIGHIESQPHAHIVFDQSQLQNFKQDLDQLQCRTLHTVKSKDTNRLDNLRSPPYKIARRAFFENQFQDLSQSAARLNTISLDKTQSKHRRQVCVNPFEIDFIKKQAHNMLMKLHQNAQRLCFFDQAQTHASLFLATVEPGIKS